MRLVQCKSNTKLKSDIDEGLCRKRQAIEYQDHSESSDQAKKKFQGKPAEFVHFFTSFIEPNQPLDPSRLSATTSANRRCPWEVK